jgi:hypothetical protein
VCLGDQGYVPFPRNHEYIYWQFPGYLVLAGFWLKFFGGSVLGMRLLSVAIGVAGLFAWRSVLRDTLRDAWIASWIVLLIAVDYGYQSSASNARMDMLCHVAGIYSIALAISYLNRASALRALASGTAFAICLTSHPMALIYCLLFAWSLWVRRSQLKNVRVAHVAAFLTPAVLAFGAWGAYAIQDWETFKLQLHSNSSYRVGGPLNPLTVLYQDWRFRYWDKLRVPNELAFLKVPVLVIYAVASILPWLVSSIRRRPGASSLLAMQALVIVALAYVDNQRYPIYFVHTLPVLLGPIVLTSEWMWRSKPVFARPLALALVSGVFVVSASMTLWKIRANAWRHDFDPVVSYLQKVVLPGELIMGGSELGFGLGFTSQLEDDRHLGFFSGRVPEYFAKPKVYYEIHSTRPQSKAAHEHRARMLRDHYEMVFENTLYEVYRHKR